MSLATKVSDLATRVGTEFKAIRTEMAAIDGAAIDDVTPSTSTVYSSDKVNDLLSAYLEAGDFTAAAILALLVTVDGAGSGLDADTLDGTSSAGFAASGHDHTGTYQPTDADLTAIAALSADGIIRKTAGTYAMDATAYAPLASPALSGNPTAPTQTAADNSTKIATTAYADASAAAAAAALVASAPTALNTLDELAAALGDDANFASTITTALGLRVRADASNGFDSTQKTQARSNIDAVSTTEVGDTTTNFVTVFEAALV